MKLSRRSFLLGTAATVACAALPVTITPDVMPLAEMLRVRDAMRELQLTGFVGYALDNSGHVEMFRYEDVFGGATIAGIIDSE